MLNKVMLIGRLGRDPELRYTQTGTPVTTLNVATDESYIDRDGNRVERTEWHRVTVFQRQAENCTTYLGKGSLIYVEGSLQTRKWQDSQGQDRYTTEVKAQRIQFLERRGGQNQEGGAAPRDDSYGSAPRTSGFTNAAPRSTGYGRPQQAPHRQDDMEDAAMGGYAAAAAATAAPAAPKADAQKMDDDLGPAFPSEASASMDEVPF